MPTHTEALLISSMIRTGDMTTYAHLGLSSDYFHVYRQEWRWLERFLIRYRKTPSVGTFRSKWPSFPFRPVEDVAHFCDEVRQEHARFLFTNMMEEAIDFIDRDDVEAAVRIMRAGLDTVESSLAGESGAYSLMSSTDLVYADVQHRVDRATKTGFSGIPTGFGTVDGITGGIQPGDYWVVGARLGQGKTWTLNNMSVQAITHGASVLFATLEQPRNQIMFRLHNLLSVKYGRRVFSSSDLMLGRGFNLLEYKRFLDQLHQQDQHLRDIHIIDGTRGPVTPGVLAANIEKTKPQVVFVDYLTLMDKREKDWQTVAKLSDDIQQLAIRYEVPVVVAAQINRTGEGRQPPAVHQLGMSDAIGQGADVVITLAQQSPHVLKLRLAKYRNGVGEAFWYAHFDPGKGIYEEISGDRARQLIEQDQEI